MQSSKAFKKVFGPLPYETPCSLTVAGNNQQYNRYIIHILAQVFLQLGKLQLREMVTCLRPHSSEVINLNPDIFTSSAGLIPLHEAGPLLHRPSFPTVLYLRGRLYEEAQVLGQEVCPRSHHFQSGTALPKLARMGKKRAVPTEAS